MFNLLIPKPPFIAFFNLLSNLTLCEFLFLFINMIHNQFQIEFLSILKISMIKTLLYSFLGFSYIINLEKKTRVNLQEPLFHIPSNLRNNFISLVKAC